MELVAGQSRSAPQSSRRRAVIAIAIFPFSHFVATLIALLTVRPRIAAPFGAFATTGMSLTGPFAWHANGVWMQSAIGFILLAALLVAAKRTRVGELHWSLLGAFMLIWMMSAFA